MVIFEILFILLGVAFMVTPTILNISNSFELDEASILQVVKSYGWWLIPSAILAILGSYIAALVLLCGNTVMAISRLRKK